MERPLTIPVSLAKGEALPITSLSERRRQQQRFFRLSPGQGERIKVRGFSASRAYLCITLTLSLSKGEATLAEDCEMLELLVD